MSQRTFDIAGVIHRDDRSSNNNGFLRKYGPACAAERRPSTWRLGAARVAPALHHPASEQPLLAASMAFLMETHSSSSSGGYGIMSNREWPVLFLPHSLSFFLFFCFGLELNSLASACPRCQSCPCLCCSPATEGTISCVNQHPNTESNHR